LWGMTFIAIAVFASPAVLFDARIPARRRWLVPGVACAVLVAMGVYGGVRLAATPTQLLDKVKLRLMQPGVKQDQRFNYSAKQAVMQKYLALSDRSTSPQSTGV